MSSLAVCLFARVCVPIFCLLVCLCVCLGFFYVFVFGGFLEVV